MKRLLLPFMALVLAPALQAQQDLNTFLWTQQQIFFPTNNPAPDIDATNIVFANGSEFGVEIGASADNTFAYTTSDTLNVTNFGFLFGVPGFDFEYYPSQPPLPQVGVPFSNMAGTFANIAIGGGAEINGFGGGTILCESLSILPPAEITEGVANLALIRVNATNIIDNGLMQMDNAGLIDLRGQHLDMRRGTFNITPNPTSAEFNISDWGSGGYGTNSGFWGPGAQLTTTTAESAAFTNFNRTLRGVRMILNNSTPYIENVNGAPNGLPGNLVWRYIFLQDSSPPNVGHNVYFGTSSDLNQRGEFHIEWIGTNQDPVTGVLTNSYLYLTDDPAARRPTNYNFTIPPIEPINTNGDFSLVASPVQIPSGNLHQPSINDFTNPWPLLVTNDFSYISLQVAGTTVTNTIVDGSVTNVPGRVQLTSSQDLSLANTRISVPYYLLLSSPNFQGNSNALISAQFADLYLGVTNGSLTLSNLLNPNVPIWTTVPFSPSAVSGDAMGGIQAWSGSFTNIITNTIVTITPAGPVTNSVATTNDVRILLVNSAIQPSGPAFQQNIQLHAPNNLTISDDLNIFGNFSSDTQVLTIATNGPGAFTPYGQINFLSPDTFWSTALPNLQYFTNWGVFSSENLTVFAGGMASPFSNPDLATPYQAFVNHGNITNGGTFIRTGDFENSGIIDDDFGGSIDIVASSANSLATNGQFLAPGGYVSITANSLLASNGIMEAGGGPIILTASCSLSDGYLLGNQFAHPTNSMLPNVVTNGNTWLTSGGIKVAGTAQQDNLLGTTIENIAFGNFASPNVWAGQDRGPIPLGFATNLAVGRLMLEADANSVFNFSPANGSNAIYIDSLELLGNTTNTDGNGNPLSIAIQPGMNLYYAEAVENGISVAEKLNGKFGAANTNGGRLFWVSNYAGVYSSTNILYPDGNTYIFNHALAISPDINSGGPDGTEITNQFLVNLNNPFPIPTNVTYDIPVQGPQPCPQGGAAGGPGGNPNNGSPQILAHLTLPPEAPASLIGGSNAPIVFSVAAGAYNGLFYDTNAVKPSSSGYFSAAVTSKGGFSAKLELGSHAYSFSGTLDSSGAAIINNVGGKRLPDLSVSLQLVNNDHFIGSVSGNNWVAQLQADRAAFTSRNGTSSAGRDTLLLASDDGNSTTNTGEGFGTAAISVGGGVQFSATLPDGVKITQKSALSKAGVWPIYSSLYGGTGVLIGWMQCTNQIDIGGSAVWEMPAGAGGLYSGGLTNQIDAAGSRIQGRVGFIGNGAAILSGAGLESSLTNNVLVGALGKTVPSSNSTLKLSVNPQTGLFSGSVTLPDSKQKLSFQGALLERSGVGGGFFLNADQSGKVYFGPAN